MRTRIGLLIVLLLLMAIAPFLFIARARAHRARSPRIHIIPDMDNQPRFEAQHANPMFADGRALRPPVEGAIARGDLRGSIAFRTGRDDNGEWVSTFPAPVDKAMIERGRERFGIYCAVCHGLAGYGDGPNALRAEELMMAGEPSSWAPPTSLHTDTVVERPDGHLFNTITNGIRTMPPYGPQMPIEDRWAIVAYVRALQRSQAASIEDVPADKRDSLR